jgi:flagellar motor switch protein FliM
VDHIKILVAEDSPASRQAIVARLGKTPHFNLVQVGDGEAALKELESEEFTLLVTDLKMPKINGLELVTEIRDKQPKKLRGIPILMMSDGSAKKDEVISAILAGTDDFLLKPYDPEVLVEKVETLLKARPPARDISDEWIKTLPEVMTQKDIDGLLMVEEKVRKAPEEKEATAESPKTRQVITYDFKHPLCVSKDQTRTLEHHHSNFARILAAEFSTHQRSVVDVDIAFVDQTTYAEFIMSLSNPSCSYTFMIEPLGGPAVLDYSLPVAYSFIDRAFGGRGKHPPDKARALTAIERSIMSPVVTGTLACLEQTWEAVLKIQVSDAELETNPEFMQIASPSDSVMLIAFEVNTQHASGLVNLCLPYFTLEPVLSYFNVHDWSSRQHSADVRLDNQQKVLNILKSVEAEIQVICGRGDVPAAEVINLREGDTILLDTRMDDPSIVYVEDKPVFFAKPGTNAKGNNTAQLIRSLPPLDYFDPINLKERFTD